MFSSLERGLTFVHPVSQLSAHRDADACRGITRKLYYCLWDYYPPYAHVFIGSSSGFEGRSHVCLAESILRLTANMQRSNLFGMCPIVKSLCEQIMALVFMAAAAAYVCCYKPRAELRA